jgi:hypothetical protein
VTATAAQKATEGQESSSANAPPSPGLRCIVHDNPAVPGTVVVVVEVVEVDGGVVDVDVGVVEVDGVVVDDGIVVVEVERVGVGARCPDCNE